MSKGENLHVYPSPIVNESRIHKQTRSVAESGLFSSVVICGTARQGLPSLEEFPFDRRVERLGAARAREPSVFARIWRQVTWSRMVYKRFSRSNVSVINAHSVAVLPVCALLSRTLGAKLIYDTHELETETVAARGLQGRIFKLIERHFINSCDAVFVVNESIAGWYANRYRGLKPVVVRNIPEAPVLRESFPMRQNLTVPDGKRLFIHVGNLAESRNIEVILQAFASPGVDDHVVFLGDGPLIQLVDGYVSLHKNIHHLPSVSPADVVGRVAACDVGLCLIEPTCRSYELSLPNKALEYAMSGLPFFFTDLPEIGNLLGSGMYGWKLADPSRDLVPAIHALTAPRIAEAKVSLRGLLLPTWDEESAVMVGKYAELIESRDR
ncbi:glycosyltransferase [Cryobacterium sp. Sr3]|uniref:glycosyltransferase n=1 Tax=Cryobacterium sp. Sr3 TaxID=1259194 RepID=UPI00106CAED0|nr:glycosyltransferase [Cryobacterium sp. Sr3]TFB55267.1 glycosyltransferase [Cryobacterium sp. Sr3]